MSDAVGDEHGGVLPITSIRVILLPRVSPSPGRVGRTSAIRTSVPGLLAALVAAFSPCIRDDHDRSLSKLRPCLSQYACPVSPLHRHART